MHEPSHGDDTNQTHQGRWRQWLWLIGCLAPVAAAVAIFAFNVQVNGVLLFGLLLLCPLSHFLLMRGGGHKH
ncbi:DUF2933 domain-containing protein [Candidatus Acetothermia bacterium]|nr:DUF2933 domain-containing protein [Candidatus Acetothermia bacterium]